MKSFLVSIRFYVLFIAGVSLAFLVMTAYELRFDPLAIILSLVTGSAIGILILVVEIYRNAYLLKSANSEQFLISHLPETAMIVMAIVANLQGRTLEYAILLMVGAYLLIYIFGLVILKFIFGKKLQIR